MFSFVLFKQNFYRKNCYLQRDSNSDRRIERLDHDHGPTRFSWVQQKCFTHSSIFYSLRQRALHSWALFLPISHVSHMSCWRLACDSICSPVPSSRSLLLFLSMTLNLNSSYHFCSFHLETIFREIRHISIPFHGNVFPTLMTLISYY